MKDEINGWFILEIRLECSEIKKIQVKISWRLPFNHPYTDTARGMKKKTEGVNAENWGIYTSLHVYFVHCIPWIAKNNCIFNFKLSPLQPVHRPLSYIYTALCTPPYSVREYWMIYRGPGFLAVVWFGSSPTSSPPPFPSVCSNGDTDWERVTTCWRERWGPNQTTARRPGPLLSVRYSLLFCIVPPPYPPAVMDTAPWG